MVRSYFMAKTTRSGPFGGPWSSIFMSLRNMSAIPLDNVLVQSGPTCLTTQRSNLFAGTSNSVQIYLNLFRLAWKKGWNFGVSEKKPTDWKPLKAQRFKGAEDWCFERSLPSGKYLPLRGDRFEANFPGFETKKRDESLGTTILVPS